MFSLSPNIKVFIKVMRPLYYLNWMVVSPYGICISHSSLLLNNFLHFASGQPQALHFLPNLIIPTSQSSFTLSHFILEFPSAHCLKHFIKATHSSTLTYEIPWMEEPGRLQSIVSQRIRHDWMTSLSLYFHLLL